MKKSLLLVLLLWIQSVFSQSFSWDTALSQIYTPTRGDSPKKVLLDKAPMFADLYNFNYPEFNTSNSNHFQQALTELNMASGNIFANQPLFPNFERIANSATEIPIGIISTRCAYLNYDEDDNSNGNLQLINNIFVPINSSVQNFIERDLLVISPLFPAFSSSTNTYKFKVDTSQFYQYMNNVKQLEADFGNGVWKMLINNFAVQPAISVNINTTGVQNQKITFHATLEDGSQVTTYAEMLLSKKTRSFVNPIEISQRSGTCGISELLKHRSTIADASGVKGEIEYKIWYGDENNTCDLRKPIIIVDGFDPGDKRRIDYNDCYKDERCYYKGMNIETYLSLSKLMEYEDGSLIDKLNKKNFDVILVNLPYYNKIPNDINSELICAGADDIIRNAYSIASFIQKINADLQTVGSTEKLVVVGPSMGGLITRYALAYLEKQGINHNTKVWVSMDSPHQGANIPLAIQEDIWFFAKMLKQNGANEQFEKLLHSPAAEQMLIDIINDSWLSNPVRNQKNINFISTLRNNGASGSNGFPVSYGIKNIAITNGSLAGTKNVNPKENFLHIKASAKIRLLGVRVGRKRIFRVNNYYMPNMGESNLLVQNQGRNPDENVGDTNFSFTINSWTNPNGSMDAVPGGNTNSANDLKEEVNASLEGTNAFSFPLSFGNWFILPILTTDKNLIIDHIIPSNKETIITPQAFIPMHSALDTSGFSDWYQPINKNISCSGQTQFDSFYGESYNMDHVSFTPNMVNWLIKSITEGIQDPVFPTTNISITGSSILQINEISNYTIDDCKIPGNATWSLSNSNAKFVSYTGSSAIIKGIANGSVDLVATFQNGQTITKTIWIGVPASPTIKDYSSCTIGPPAYCQLTNFPATTYGSSIPLEAISSNGLDVASLTNNDCEWERISGDFYFTDGAQTSTTSINRKAVYIKFVNGKNLTNSSFLFRFRIKNNCGWGEWRNYVWGSGSGSGSTTPPTQPPSNYYMLSPNPAQTYTTVVMKNSNVPPPSPTMYAELFNPISGQMLSKVYFYNGIATFNNLSVLTPGSPYYVKVTYSNGSSETITLMKN